MNYWAPHVTVAAVIPNPEKTAFLMVEELGLDKKPVFNQPAGHLDPDESIIDAVVREVYEETGHQFTPSGVVGFYQWKTASGDSFLRACFVGSIENEELLSPPDTDILRTHWLSLAQLNAMAPSRLRSPLVTLCITDALKRPPYPLEMLHDLG